jgi:hypothetical protein
MQKPPADDQGSAKDPNNRANSARVPKPAAGIAVIPAPPTPSTSTPPDHFGKMPQHILFLAVAYLAVLIGLFVAYFTSHWLRLHVPANLGPLPVGVVWFGASGAVVASLYGIFVHNRGWDPSYSYWHYCRPLFGAVIGSVGALMYLVLLHLGSAGGRHGRPPDLLRGGICAGLRRQVVHAAPPECHHGHHQARQPPPQDPIGTLATALLVTWPPNMRRVRRRQLVRCG